MSSSTSEGILQREFEQDLGVTVNTRRCQDAVWNITYPTGHSSIILSSNGEVVSSLSDTKEKELYLVVIHSVFKLFSRTLSKS